MIRFTIRKLNRPFEFTYSHTVENIQYENRLELNFGYIKAHKDDDDDLDDFISQQNYEEKVRY